MLGVEIRPASSTSISRPACAGLYSHPHEDTGLIELGSNIRGSQSHDVICALNLSVAVMMFNHSYAAIGDALPQLVDLCERAVPLRPD